MTTHACEVQFRSFPGGLPENMQIELPDSVNTDDPAAVRAYVDAEVSRRIRAGHLAPGEITYDIYVDKNDTAGFQGDERLGFGDDRTTLAWGTTARHPLTANIRAMQGDVMAAAVTGLDNVDLDPDTDGDQTIPANSLAGLDYVSDGQDDVSQSEARSLLARFQGLFPNTADGHRQLFEAYRRNPDVRFGPAPRDTISLQEAYRIAGVPTPDGTSQPQIPGAPGGADDPSNPAPGSPEDVARQILSNPVNMSGLDAQDRRILAELRRLIAMLLMGGDPDILLAQAMNLQTLMSKNGMARAGVMVSQAMERVQNQINENSDTIAELYGAGHTGREAGRDQGEITRLTTANQTLNASLQSLTRLLQSFTEASAETSEMAKNASDFHSRQSRYMAWS